VGRAAETAGKPGRRRTPMGQQRRRQTALATPSVAQPSCPSADLHSDVLLSSRRKGIDVVKRGAEKHFVVVFFHIAQVRCAQAVGQGQQRVIRTKDRLFFIHIHSGKAGSPSLQGLGQNAGRDQTRAAGVDQQGVGLHAGQVSGAHIALGLR